jgi:hypothetical protein
MSRTLSSNRQNRDDSRVTRRYERGPMILTSN